MNQQGKSHQGNLRSDIVNIIYRVRMLTRDGQISAKQETSIVSLLQDLLKNNTSKEDVVKELNSYNNILIDEEIRYLTNLIKGG